jgi:hypothetical protein
MQIFFQNFHYLSSFCINFFILEVIGNNGLLSVSAKFVGPLSSPVSVVSPWVKVTSLKFSGSVTGFSEGLTVAGSDGAAILK